MIERCKKYESYLSELGYKNLTVYVCLSKVRDEQSYQVYSDKECLLIITRKTSFLKWCGIDYTVLKEIKDRLKLKGI